MRLAACVILIVNLAVRDHDGGVLVHLNVIATYGVATLLALGFAMARRGPSWMGTAFVVVDAALVVALFHEHLLTSINRFGHNLTAPTLAIGFLLLTHVALRLCGTRLLPADKRREAPGKLGQGGCRPKSLGC